MTALSGIILCFLPFLGIRSAYTKSYRAVHFGIKGEGITKYPSLDLVTRELPQALEKLCTEHLCLSKELEEIVYDWVDNHSCTILKTSHVYLLRGTQAPQYPTSDKSVTTNRDAEFQEIHNLFKGNLVCRTSCDPSSLVYRRDCKFAKLISEFRIYPPVPFAMLTFEQWSYLFEFGDALFNLQLYIHAEAWCYYLVHNLLYFDRTGKDDRELTFDTESPVVGFSTLTISQHRLLIRGSLLLSEVAKLKGQLEVATHHSLRVIRSHNLLAADFNKTLPNFAVLSRLRILLTIPPTPPTYVDAVKYRQEMIQDMRTFQQSIVDSNIRLSLEVILTAGVKFFFFKYFGVCHNVCTYYSILGFIYTYIGDAV